MRLAPDQPQQGAAVLASKRRQFFDFRNFDQFHDTYGTPHVGVVNSVSLQPASMPPQAPGQKGCSALVQVPRLFDLSELFERLAV